jgi:Sigma-70 region 2
MYARSPAGGKPAKTLTAAQAVEQLIQAYGNLVFQTIYGLTGDWEESQDLTQDTFLQALRAIDSARATSGADFQSLRLAFAYRREYGAHAASTGAHPAFYSFLAPGRGKRGRDGNR